MNIIPHFNRFTDPQLIDVMPRLVATETSATVVLVAALMAFDVRRLYLPLGYPSLFKYCVAGLKLTEDATFTRLEVARAARKHPLVLERLHSGELSLTAARMLAPHLTAENHRALLDGARHKTKREIELLIAKAKPQPAVPSVIRRLPEPKPSEAVSNPEADLPAPAETPLSLSELCAPAPPPPSRRPVVAPLSESQYKLQVTISAGARERLAQIQDLMRHRLPNGDPAAIVEHALEVLHAELLKEKAAIVAKPRAGKSAAEARGRYIPASVRREVWRRDHGKCAFVRPDGTTCGSTSGLEFHHVQPYAAGGQATAGNIELRCRAHNGFEWERHLEQEMLALAGEQA